MITTYYNECLNKKKNLFVMHYVLTFTSVEILHLLSVMHFEIYPNIRIQREVWL